MEGEGALTVLVKVDVEVLTELELAGQLLRRDHADGALLRLDLLRAFHCKFVRNYSETRRRGL